MITAVAVMLVLAALYFTLRIRERDIPEPLPVSPVQYLEDRKQAIYGNLRDLQFEYRLGKLTDEDYQQNKRALQRELAVVLAEMEAKAPRTPPPTAKSAPAVMAATRCPHCGAKFPRPLKFCGECGKSMAK